MVDLPVPAPTAGTPEPESPDHPRSDIAGVRAVSAAVGVTVVGVLPVFLLGGLAVQIGASLRFGATGLGVAVATYFGISALAAVPVGRLVERYGSRTTSHAAVLISAVTLLAIGLFARTYPVLLVLLALAAVTNTLGQLASNLLLAKAVPVRRQGFSFGVKQAAVPIATLLAGAAVPTIALTVGWRWAFIAAGVLAMGALVLVPGNARRAGSRADRDTERATAALVVIGFACVLAAGSANALGSFIVSSAVHRGLSPGLAGLTLTMGSAICVAARLLGGWLADLRTGGHLPVVAGLLGVGAIGLALLAVASPVALVVGVLLGFGLGWSWPGVVNFAVVRLNPSAPAAATSITQTGVYGGACLGPLGFGTLATHAGYPTAWTAAAVAMVLASAGMLVGQRMLRLWQPRAATATPLAAPRGVAEATGLAE